MPTRPGPLPLVTQTDAEAGTSLDQAAWNPLRVAQSVAALETPAQIHFSMMNTAAGYKFTNMPAADTLFANSGMPMIVDLTNYTQIRLTVARSVNVSQAAAVLMLRYKTGTPTLSVGDYVIMGATEVEADITAVNTITNSGWISLVAGAQAEVSISLVTNGGNGVQDPWFINVTVQAK